MWAPTALYVQELSFLCKNRALPLVADPPALQLGSTSIITRESGSSCH